MKLLEFALTLPAVIGVFETVESSRTELSPVWGGMQVGRQQSERQRGQSWDDSQAGPSWLSLFSV